jgi:tight adherence protein C
MLLFWVAGAWGAALLLSAAPWFRRTSLVARIGPYSRRRPAAPRPTTGATLRQLALPVLEVWGARASRALGVTQDLATRLERAGRVADPSAFRLRQVTIGTVTLLMTAAAVVGVRPPPVLSVVGLVGLPVLAMLLEERRLGTAIDDVRRRIRAELPVVAEQLGLLLSAGYSLPSAIGRLAERSDGAAAADLRQVNRRVRQGMGTSDALGEWALRADIEAVDRLVAVLRLHDDAGDLGALIAEEARSIRAGAHRDLVEVIERRSQLVWVPVTVATLVPGLIFLAVPFMSAMAQVTGG